MQIPLSHKRILIVPMILSASLVSAGISVMALAQAAKADSYLQERREALQAARREQECLEEYYLPYRQQKCIQEVRRDYWREERREAFEDRYYPPPIYRQPPGINLNIRL